MAHYEIIQTETGHSFGTYEGETPDAAIAAMLADAGHDGDADPGLRAVEVAAAEIDLDRIDDAAEAHVADVLSMGVLSAADLAEQSDDAALETWDRLGLLAASGLPRDASDVDLDRARTALAQAIREAAEARVE